MNPASAPAVAVVMGSTSDWETMRHAVETLEQFGVPWNGASSLRTARRS
jgi:5-(carboxyamino)imidazole ribonucleotide mutase